MAGHWLHHLVGESFLIIWPYTPYMFKVKKPVPNVEVGDETLVWKLVAKADPHTFAKTN